MKKTTKITTIDTEMDKELYNVTIKDIKTYEVEFIEGERFDIHLVDFNDDNFTQLQFKDTKATIEELEKCFNMEVYQIITNDGDVIEVYDNRQKNKNKNKGMDEQMMEKIIKATKENNMELVNELTKDLSYNEKLEIKEKLEEKRIEIRICDNCHKFMKKGYVVCDGDEHYCSEECLYKEIDEEEWKKLCAYLIEEDERTEEEEEWADEYGDTGCYWTEW